MEIVPTFPFRTENPKGYPLQKSSENVGTKNWRHLGTGERFVGDLNLIVGSEEAIEPLEEMMSRYGTENLRDFGKDEGRASTLSFPPSQPVFAPKNVERTLA
jgi:hypothetical protein